MMSSKYPVFPMPDIQQHFSYYGFHPHYDYFQVLEEEARKQKENPSTDSLHNFKLQKPITGSSQEDCSKIINKIKKHTNSWWKHALHFFKAKWSPHHHTRSKEDHHHHHAAAGVQPIPVYTTDSRSGSSTPYRTTSRPHFGALSPVMSGDNNLPYMSLRDFNDEQQQRISASSPMPIYLVT